MKNKGLLFIILAVIILLAMKFLFFPTPSPEKKGAPGGKKGEEMVMTDGYIARVDTLSRTYTTSGNLIAGEESELRPEISGKIERIYFNEGEKVQKGKLLVKINDAEWQANLKKAGHELTLINQRLERQKKLLEVSGVSKEEYEATVAQANSIQAQMDAIQAQISRTEIRAPFNGTIGIRSVSEGSYVSPANRIASIQQVDSLKLDFNVPARFADILKKGVRVTFMPEGSSKENFAFIQAIEPRIDEASRTIAVRAYARNTTGTLYPGSFVSVLLPLPSGDKGFYVPSEAIVPGLKGKKVFVSEKGKAVERSVTTGERTQNQVLILEGLNEGDTVLTSGLLSVRNGVKLKFRRVR